MKNESSVNKQTILIGTILLLLVAIIAQFVLLNAYFNNRLSRIQNVGASNYTRLQKVGSFVQGLASQIKPATPAKDQTNETNK